MSNRREFLIQTASAVASGVGASSVVAHEAPDTNSRSTNSLHILMIGGAGFIGSHQVRIAVERGHQVTVLDRSLKGPLPAGVKVLLGDRFKDLHSLDDQEWDVVVDFAAFVPSAVRSLAEALRGRVKRYTLISTISTYARVDDEKTESSAQLAYDGPIDPYAVRSVTNDFEYGSFKVLCEREALAQFPRATLIIRPGVVIGPGSGFLSVWFSRMEQGGETLVPGDPLSAVQLIDVRDLTMWIMRMIEEKETGPWNAVGPSMRLTNAEFMGAIRSLFSSSLQLTWVASRWLIDQKIGLHTGPLFWTKAGVCTQREDHWVSYRVSSAKAIAKGLTFRSLATTLEDDLASYRTRQPRSQQERHGLGLEFEKTTLAAWHAQRDKSPTYSAAPQC